MPKAAGEEDLRQLVAATLASCGRKEPTGSKDMGTVMKTVQAKIQAAASGPTAGW